MALEIYGCYTCSLLLFLSMVWSNESQLIMIERTKRDAIDKEKAAETNDTCEEVGSEEAGYCWEEEARPKSPSLRRFIPKGYDMYLPPFKISNEPVPLFFSVKARDIQRIDEDEMDITIEWFLRIFWTDPRLVAPSDIPDKKWYNIEPEIAKSVWLPTTYIDHVRDISFPKLLISPKSFRMQNNGFIRYSISTTTRMSCPMDFAAYPFDTQNCFFDLESYQFTANEVHYQWLNDFVELGDRIKPMHFDYLFVTQKQQNANHQNRSFPRLSVKIILKRRISYHIMNTYCPSTLLVMVSWLTFLVPNTEVPGRMVLTITTLLTLMSMFSTVRNEGPQVSYAKAIDQWMMMCVVFVFMVLIEFTIVLYIKGKIKKKILRGSFEKVKATKRFSGDLFVQPKGSPLPFQDKEQIMEEVEIEEKGSVFNCYNASRETLEKLEESIERYTWMFLLALFIILNIAYWTYWISFESKAKNKV